MHDQPPEKDEICRPVKFNENLVCDVCGRFGAVELGDRRLCADCYESSGSCCPEFGRDE